MIPLKGVYLWLYYHWQVSSLLKKSSVASKWANKHLWGTIYFAVDGTSHIHVKMT